MIKQWYTLLQSSWVILSYMYQGFSYIEMSAGLPDFEFTPAKDIDSKLHKTEMSRNVRNHAFGHGHLEKIQISLRVRAFCLESLGAFWLAKDAKFLHADNEDSNQTARMRSLVWVFVGRTCQKMFFLQLRLLWWDLLNKSENQVLICAIRREKGTVSAHSDQGLRCPPTD